MKRSMDATGDRDTAILAAGVAGLVVVGVGGVWVCEHLAAVLTGRPRPTSDPLLLVVAVARGQVAWGPAEWLPTAGLAVVVLVLVVGVIVAWPKRGGEKMRPDMSARHMGRGRDVAHLTAAGSEKIARRLGTTGPGLPLGRAVASGHMLHGSWEDMAVLVAGPRTQKTTAYAIPAVLAAPGAALATSDKRDLLDATRTLRAKRGTVWVFDPQNVADEGSPAWWWNPLSYVTNETRADRMAAQLVTSARPAGAKTDAYFDTEAENLISLLLLAAACGGLPIIAVYSWLTRPTSEDAADILKDHGYALQYQALYGLSKLPPKQQEGVYGTARSLTGWLRNREVAPG